jgi:hypothetical protein
MNTMRVATVTTIGCLALLTAACSSTSGSSSAAGSSSSSPSAAGQAGSAGSGASSAASSPAGSAPATSAVAVSPTATAPVSLPTIQAATDTFIAAGQILSGTPLYKPACGGTGCQLSGDSTVYLSGMTWSSWTTSTAVGTGTVKLDSCTPSCANGKVYPVPTVVTFSQPVKACIDGTFIWLWTRASFSFPKGLPQAVQGVSNPWNFTQLAQDAHLSCT